MKTTGLTRTALGLPEPAPAPETYRKVKVPVYVARLWSMSLGRIWRRAVDAAWTAIADDIEANIDMRGLDLADGQDIVEYLRGEGL